jgi:hypothetical protein
MNDNRQLLYRLDILNLELELACEKGYDFMRARIEYEIDRVTRELVESRDFESPPPYAE